MKIVLSILLIACYAQAETLVDKLKDKNVSGLTESVKDTRTIETKEQERLRILTDRPKPAVEGVAIELFKVDVDKNTSVGVEYAPPLQHGEMIDNKEQTTIKFEHKF